MATALVFMAGACIIASDSNAETNPTVSLDKSVVETSGKAYATIEFKLSDSYKQIEITYSAKLTNDAGTTQSNAVSPSSGSLGVGVKEKLTINAPTTAGAYKLVVDFTYTLDDKSSRTVSKTVTLNVMAPIVLTVNLENTSETDLTDLLLDFYVDGKIVNEGKPVKVTVKAGETTTATYNYATDSLKNGSHTFKASVSDDSLIKGSIKGLDEEQSFYVGHTSYGFLTAIMVVFLVVLVIIAIYVYRKPVKNYGKPKARR